MTDDPTPNVAPLRPFPGIESFSFADRTVYFGRGVDARRLLQLVVVYRSTMLFGPSGVGKSSLLNAGLLPLALAEGMVPERIRVRHEGDTEFAVERIRRAAGGYLPSVLVEGGAGPAVEISSEELIDGVAGDRTVLLIFDQLEEMITLPDAGRARELQRDVVRTITRLTSDPNLHVKVLLSFREDYLAPIRSLFRGVADLDDHALRLAPIDPEPDALYELIRGPFDTPDSAFDNDIPAPVARRLSVEFSTRFTSDRVNLSELQIVSQRLFEVPDPGKELDDRGCTGIIEDYYTRALGRLDDRLQVTAIEILGRLVTEDGTRNIVSREDLLSGLASDDESSGLVSDALDALEHTARMISAESRHGVAFYEIVSEYLVPWIVEQQTRLRRRNPLAVAAAEWHRSGDPDLLLRAGPLTRAQADPTTAQLESPVPEFLEASARQVERRRRRRLGLVAAGVTVLAMLVVVSVVIAAIAINQRDRAVEATAEADEQAARAEDEAAAALASQAEAEAAVADAFAARTAAEDAVVEAEAARTAAEQAAAEAEEERARAEEALLRLGAVVEPSALGTITGTATELGGDAPIEGVEVVAATGDETSTTIDGGDTTASNGTYVLADRPTLVTTFLSYESDGYCPGDEEVVLAEGESRVVDVTLWREDAPIWLDVANGEIGVMEDPDGSNEGPRIDEYNASVDVGPGAEWAGSFVNWVMEQSGFVGTDRLNSSAWLDWGRELTEPVPGAIVVFLNDDGSGFVGFYVDGVSDESFTIVAGNSMNSVNNSERTLTGDPGGDVSGYRWPECSDVAE